MPLPEPRDIRLPGGLELMLHQAQLIQSAADGHRTFLLADEPGLGKTAQALLAAQAADAFPLLAVVPNVVKTNWAREASIWTPNRQVTVIHGDGDDVNGFADIVVVNYEILDRHVGWLGDFGFRDDGRRRGALHQEQAVAALAERAPPLRADPGPHRPAAADGADRHAADQRHRGLPRDLGVPRLDRRQEAAGQADGQARGDRADPGRPGLLPGRPQRVVDMGIVRRRKVDVAADIPARRIADLPGGARRRDRPLDPRGRARARPAAGRALRHGARHPAYRSTVDVEGIDHELVRRVATWEREDTTTTTKAGDNVFTMLRRIGQAKAGLAADYAAQLARNVGKVVFFAKHVDVMDAGETFAKRGIRYSEIRGDQTPKAREAASRPSRRTPTSRSSSAR